MRLLIFEDEKPAANRIRRLVEQCAPEGAIMDLLDSVEAAASWLEAAERSSDLPDLILADIQLADGLVFELFDRVKVRTPVIFTTAFDQYTLRAFRVNSVDYLLKPIEVEALTAAFDKYRDLHSKQSDFPAADPAFYRKLMESMEMAAAGKVYQERFLLRQGEKLRFVQAAEVAYFYSEDGLTRLVTDGKRQDIIDPSLDELEARLDPRQFHRVSRKLLVSLQSIRAIHKHFNGRLKLDLEPESGFEALVSRDRAEGFRSWLDS